MSSIRQTGPPEVLEISPEGAIAGHTFALLLIVSALTLIVASWDELWAICGEVEGRCVERSASGGLLLILGVLAIVGGVAIWIKIRRRPVDPLGSSRYIWALGVLFAVGMVLVAARIPAFTCEQGRFDDALRLCTHPTQTPSTSEAATWLLPKAALVVLGLVGGVVIGATPKLVRLWVVVTVLAWTAGLGRIVVETLVRT